MIKVAVAGYSGRMGSTVVDAVSAADDMEVVCGIDPYAHSSTCSSISPNPMSLQRP